MRKLLLVASLALAATAIVPSAASAQGTPDATCSEFATLSIGVPLPDGLIGPGVPSPVGQPDLTTGPGCTINLDPGDLSGASSITAKVVASGTGLVAGKVRVSTGFNTFSRDCGPSPTECQTETTAFSFSGGLSFAFVRCHVSGVVAALTGVRCDVFVN